ncbi:MAG: single-stranded-DNA-specific exonuclease RecJ [Xanthomonadales bacterium]|nr:single-stranded-DNA-specific exonuclease RecJ [Xanthomonadales bacterium]
MIVPQMIRQRIVPGGADHLPEGLHPVLRRILLARGVNEPAALQLDISRMLPPQQLAGIDRAAQILADAVRDGKRILVVGDFDADGAMGTAVAVLALKWMGCSKVSFRVPNRFEFGYGLTVPLVDTLADDPPDVLVTVDSGISCVRGVARAVELGCRVIITDHHLPGEVLPAADAIVNPNCAGDTFPSKAMAGVGVMFYLACVLRQVLRERNWFSTRRPEPNLAALLDLVALGTVADLVPLDHNNRVLVRQGLERIRRGQTRPGLLALLRASSRDYRYVGAADLGFAIGPRLNAAGRLEDMGIGIRCLLSEDRAEADSLALQLDELNQQRRELQEQMQDEALQQVKQWIARLQGSTALPAAVCLYDESWHQGVVGLVASRVKDAVHRPVVAFAPEGPGSGMLKGSARSVKGLHIRDVLALVDARNPGLMSAFGGHAMAAGLTLPATQLDTFRECLLQAVLTVLDGATLEAEVLTDGTLEPADIGLELAVLLQNLGPWGQRFAEPLFDGLFEVLQHRVVGGSHLRMTLRPQGARTQVEGIAFNHMPEDLPPGGGPVRLLYKLDINRWRGSETCQLMVERIVTPPVEKTGKR